MCKDLMAETFWCDRNTDEGKKWFEENIQIIKETDEYSLAKSKRGATYWVSMDDDTRRSWDEIEVINNDPIGTVEKLIDEIRLFLEQLKGGELKNE